MRAKLQCMTNEYFEVSIWYEIALEDFWAEIQRVSERPLDVLYIDASMELNLIQIDCISPSNAKIIPCPILRFLKTDKHL